MIAGTRTALAKFDLQGRLLQPVAIVVAEITPKAKPTRSVVPSAT